MTRNIADEIAGAGEEFVAYLRDKKTTLRETVVSVPEAIDVRSLRANLHLSQVEFARRFGVPLHSLRRWETGKRQPDAAARAYLSLIGKDPKAVAALLAA